MARDPNTIHNYLDDIKNILPPTTTNSTPTTPSRTQTVTRVHQIQVKLFDGNSRFWPAFRDSFRSAVEHTDLSPVEKLNYLQSCLSGAAPRSIEGYALTNDNYAVVWKFLEEKYGDPTQLKRTFYAELESLNDNNRDFYHTYETTERILRQLEVLHDDLGNPYLQWTIERKQPRWILENLNRKKQKYSTWSMNDTHNHLHSIVKVKQSALSLLNTNSKSPIAAKLLYRRSSSIFQQTTTNAPYTSSAFAISKRNTSINGSASRTSTIISQPMRQRTSSIPSCAFCSDKH
ncbi:unnamed protein product [Anisakis simplex]|uniref:Retrotransposon gag domain-containing protein n=1 Tax=Anisakis simplex TaxID=6269 RepID=A0A0M3J9V5_ANISI|nr:unnamed protein product [Anisakis simplex]